MPNRKHDATKHHNAEKDVFQVKEAVRKVISFRRFGGWLDGNVQNTLNKVIKTGFDKFKSAFASENIFYGSRSKFDVPENYFDEIDYLARNMHDIREIADDHDIESLEERFLYLIALERISENIDISKRHRPDIDNADTAEAALRNLMQQDTPTILKNKLFFVTKALACSRENDYDYHMDRENFHLIKVPENDLRREYLRQKIKNLFSEAAETVFSNKSEFESFVRSITDEFIEDNQISNISQNGQELWAYRDRTTRENPVMFIRRVYAIELADGSLTRAQLAHLDPKLYQAYASWIRPERHPEDDIGLPTQTYERISDPAEALERVRKLARERTQKYRKSHKPPMGTP